MTNCGHFLHTDGPGVVGLTEGIFSTLMVLELYDSLWAFSPHRWFWSFRTHCGYFLHTDGPGVVVLTVGIFLALMVLELYYSL